MDQRVQRVKTLIENSFARELSVSEMARFVHLSVSHLQHLFKTDMGQSPAHYVQAVRLQRATELLESSSLSVKQIMIRVGAKDRSNFERRFKQAYKLTPVQYRKVAGLHASKAWQTMPPPAALNAQK
jgi:transcriptional regulator GlxA family with amidase domain